MSKQSLKERLENGSLDARLEEIYVSGGAVERAKANLTGLLDVFQESYPDLQPSLYTASGRTEMGGNHTDHQLGRVLAGSVDMETNAVAAPNGNRFISVVSTQYPEDRVDLGDLDPKVEEEGKSISLVRGIARALVDRGYDLEGATILTKSGVPGGSGLSSSAAFETLIGNVLNHLFCGDELSAEDIAQIGQYAENVYFGKPSGLMDQMACSVGGIIEIDFEDEENPVVEHVNFDLGDAGYALCIIDSGADHADLTDDYTQITEDMGAVAGFFGKTRLREVDPDLFWAQLPKVREATSDRAVARAIHFFGDNDRVEEQIQALRENDFPRFLELVKDSGRSSGLYLQNLHSTSSADQSVLLTIALAEKLLDGRGAVRVHGGGFAGTVQAYVPLEDVDAFKEGIESVLGEGSCYVVEIRPVGGAFIAE